MISLHTWLQWSISWLMFWKPSLPEIGQSSVNSYLFTNYPTSFLFLLQLYNKLHLPERFKVASKKVEKEILDWDKWANQLSRDKGSLHEGSEELPRQKGNLIMNNRWNGWSWQEAYPGKKGRLWGRKSWQSTPLKKPAVVYPLCHLVLLVCSVRVWVVMLLLSFVKRINHDHIINIRSLLKFLCCL